MTAPVRVLIVEDSEDDVQLLLRQLRRGGFDPQWTRVDSPEGLASALAGQAWDVVICDYSMPHLDAPRALEIVQGSGRDIPFIIVSGKIGEDTAVAAMKAGAHDYVMKDRLDRLPAAVEREVREAAVRRDHERARAALRESEERYRAIVDQAADGIFIMDLEGRILEVNDAFARSHGYTTGELREIGLGGIDVDAASTPDRMRRVLAGERLTFEVEHWRKDMSRIHLEVTASLAEFAGKHCIMAFHRDITERKQLEVNRRQLEEQLRASQKMEAIGILAGGIAHDFNNLLSVILSYTGIVLNAVREEDPLRNDLVEVKKSAERAAALTQQLLAFGRKQVLQPVPLSFNMVAEGCARMLLRILGEDIDFRMALAPDLGVALADPGQMEQVLMNLVLNARDAMPRGGKLTIETSNAELDEEYAAQHLGVKPGPYVMLAVTDTGCGMGPKILERVFEPFFTTKEKGKGTGLGLPMVYGIVKQSEGQISVHSEPGKGASFKIYLPRDLSARAREPTRTAPVSTRTAGTETILVVEDEEALLRVAKRGLGQAGYTVLTAGDGEEALRIAAAHPGTIHLLATDVIMPRMGGNALATELSKSRPGLKILYMSGYTDDAILHHGVLEPGTHFLAKPITSVDLVRKVREVLDAASRS
jgi:two-component system cell cycle sensor histidine kinase/response regulator CckA